MASFARSILPPDFFMPQKGGTLAQEMECYSLPFGGLGFASHILAYYTIAVLAMGRSPLRPWKPLTHAWYDMWLSSISFVGGSAIAVFTLVRCRSHWQLLLIGIWKLSMSVLNGVIGVHAATIISKFSKEQRSRNAPSSSRSYLPLTDDDDDAKVSPKSGPSIFSFFSRTSRELGTKETRAGGNGKGRKVQTPSTAWVLLWIILYVPGMIVGFVGLISLIFRNWSGHPALHVVVYIFAGLYGLILFASFGIGIGLGFCIGDFGIVSVPTILFLMFTMLSALFCDWSLGAMTNNLLGTPQGDLAILYWLYFGLKRLTMFSL